MGLVLRRILFVHEKERLGIGGVGDFRHGAGRVDRGWIFASFRKGGLPRVEGGVEVGFEILYRNDGILFRWPAAPPGVPVAPMRECDVAGRIRDVFVHPPQQDAVGIEGDRVGRPIEAILVEAFIGRERELLHVKSLGVGRIKAVLERLGRLEDEVDGMRGFVVLGGEKLHVDFLGIIVVLRSHNRISAATVKVGPTRVASSDFLSLSLSLSLYVPRRTRRRCPCFP